MSVPEPVLKVEDLMEEVRRRVRDRLGSGNLGNEEASVLIEEVMQNALDLRDGEGRLQSVDLLGPEEEWVLNRPLRFSSHRGTVGRYIVWAKEKVIFPLTRWLYEYTRMGFFKQHRMNLTLLACLESVITQNASLQARVRILEEQVEQLRWDNRGDGTADG